MNGGSFDTWKKHGGIAWRYGSRTLNEQQKHAAICDIENGMNFNLLKLLLCIEHGHMHVIMNLPAPQKLVVQ